MSTRGEAACELLAWDSEFWGFRVARVTGDTLTDERAEQVEGWCRANDVACAYFLARSDDARTTTVAENRDYRFVDVRVNLRHHLSGLSLGLGSKDEESLSIRHSRPDDVPRLERIAKTTHRDTRFYYDLNFPRDLCDALYETWIRRSCEGYADAVLVAEAGGEVGGYISCHLDAEARSGKIGLVGVGEGARGAGFGRALVERSLAWFHDQGAAEVTVVTQARNGAAQRLYQRCGFLTRDVNLWYHKWYRTSGSRHE